MAKRFYCFKCGNGHKTQMFIPYEDTKKEYHCPNCGGVMHRDYKAEHTLDRSGDHGIWPMVSESAAVHPSQIAEAKKLIHDKAGVNCEFDNEGRPTFTSMAHQRKCLKALGLAPGHTDRYRWI